MQQNPVRFWFWSSWWWLRWWWWGSIAHDDHNNDARDEKSDCDLMKPADLQTKLSKLTKYKVRARTMIPSSPSPWRRAASVSRWDLVQYFASFKSSDQYIIKPLLLRCLPPVLILQTMFGPQVVQLVLVFSSGGPAAMAMAAIGSRPPDFTDPLSSEWPRKIQFLKINIP